MTGTEQRFVAEELEADASLAPVALSFAGSPEAGWRITRNEAPHLSLGAGYRLLAVERCGVCSTDLDRPFLPFPLPQVVGHELVARDERGERCVVEINASHTALGQVAECAFCRAGLASHCPDRLVVGIHDLPGGFGPYVLAPARAVLRVPDDVPDDVAVLVEPFAAALHAVDRIVPRTGARIAVLGPRRLGLLAVAALAARRREHGADFHIEAWSRHRSLCDRALDLGADAAQTPPAASEGPCADVVVDTTGSPDGFELALALAAREVHLKSTHGQPSGGLGHATELVVDEISLARLPAPADEASRELARHALPRAARPVVAWLCDAEPPRAVANRAEIVRGADARELLRSVEARSTGLRRADVAVVDTLARADAAIRPEPGREVSLVRPRGAILHRMAAGAEAEPATAIGSALARGVRVGTSRCGDFTQALALLERDPALRSGLARLVTHHLPARRLADALRIARGPDAIKVVVEHPTAVFG